MRYLLILNAALFALAVTLTVVLGVVCLLYGFHTELSSRVGAEMPSVIAATLAFGFIALFTGLAFWSLLKGVHWRWWGQGIGLLGLGLGSQFLYNLFTA